MIDALKCNTINYFDVEEQESCVFPGDCSLSRLINFSTVLLELIFE